MSETLVARPERPRPRWGQRGTAGATFAGRLAFEAVSLSFGPIAAVKSVSFDLEPGEVVCLLGPSGCGKSSVLRLAAGIERPDSGRILIDRFEMAGSMRFMPPEKRNIGLMFQDFALFPHLTVVDNVAFGLRALKRGAALAEARHALRRVGLEGYEASYPHSLSGGEQQRVALARAVVPRPQVMLMDEPFSGLDQRLRETVRSETLALLRETGATVMLVTHDPVEAMSLADRILLMRRGKLVQAGGPDEVYRSPADAEAARFFSDCNELACVVRQGVVASPIVSMPVQAAEGSAVSLMIRPQAISLTQSPDGFDGFVTARRFLGDATQLSVRVEGLEEPLLTRLAAGPVPQIGETARFAVDPAQVLLFSAADGSPV
ncbi:ABC transporter ATP-binding protein [soil metagenome]